LLFAALALVPAGAHVAELPNEMTLSADEYLTVQQIYRGSALFGFVVFGALSSTQALALMRRRHSQLFRARAVGVLARRIGRAEPARRRGARPRRHGRGRGGSRHPCLPVTRRSMRYA
jgi:hypothetical protein